jgi:hypothetical protein
MNFHLHFQFGFFFICLVSIAGFWGCGSSVDEKEFLGKFSELSNRRIQFRLNMKALGDSTNIGCSSFLYLLKNFGTGVYPEIRTKQ